MKKINLKNNTKTTRLSCLILSVLLIASVAKAQDNQQNQGIQDKVYPTVKLNGPRFGFTYISPGLIAGQIRGAQDPNNTNTNGTTITQFGWQFEWRYFTLPSGVCGLVEFVPLIGGLDQGLFLPSCNLLVGVRSRDGLEFGFGPNLSIAGVGFVFAAGTNIKIDQVNFPINIAFVPSYKKSVTTYDNNPPYATHTVTEDLGARISLIIGFNARKR